MPRGWYGFLCIGLGLVLILSSFNLSWGTAYGQTVVTPTPYLLIADPQITKTGQPECCEPGEEVVYTLTVTNIGTADATNVVISDTLPAELTLVSVTTSKGTVTVSGNQFQVNIGTVAPGEIVTIVVRATYPGGTPPGTVLLNTAFLRSDQGDRQASAAIVIQDPGGCKPPEVPPPTGDVAPEPRGGISIWLLLTGLVFLTVGIVLSVGNRRQPTAR